MPGVRARVFLQQLALLSQFDLDALDPMGADFIHTVVECAKLAYADRESFYGDPKASDIPLDILLSDDYARERAKLVGSSASLELRASHLARAAERLATIAARAGSEVPMALAAAK